MTAKSSAPVAPQFFATSAQFRAWFEKHHATETELYVGFYKTASGRPSITWPQSVDEALCFGWIDGVRKSLGADSYMIRFTPRRTKKSIWSRVNLQRIEELISEGRVAPAGQHAYQSRDPTAANKYSFERDTVEFTSEQQALFKGNRKAWTFWNGRTPTYRKQATWWVISAKQEVTRQRRLETLMADSANGELIGPLKRP